MKRSRKSSATTSKRSWKYYVATYWQLYLFLVPAILYFVIFRYVPMAGVQMAFRNYNAIGGVWGSPWVGLDHFIRFFNSPDCLKVIGNTLKISILNLVCGFPVPIILALFLNQTRNLRFKKIVQTTIYAPHFISAVIIVGMLNLFLSPTSGVINLIIQKFGGTPIMFMASPELFPVIYILSEIWQNMGYSSIVYVAALSSVSPELHESATVDGATMWQQIRYIDFPSILPTVVILLILSAGRILTVGYEKIYLMQTALNLSASEIISTYVYKQSFGSVGLPNFSYSAAIGLFESVVSLVVLVMVNKFAKRYSEISLT